MKNKIILSSIILLFTFLIFPFVVVHFYTPDLTIDRFLQNEVSVLTENALLNESYNFNEQNSWFSFRKKNHLEIDSTFIPISVEVYFINGKTHTGGFNRFLFRNKEYITIPLSIVLKFDNTYDSSVINYLNKVYSTNLTLDSMEYIEIPNEYPTYGFIDWPIDKTFDQRITLNHDQDSSNVVIYYEKSIKEQLLHLYIKQIYFYLPEILQPNWFKIYNRN
jgi:hypothetical protein